jgi:hypothetical protein
MLYAKYGRIGVELLQSVFSDLDLRQDHASVQMVKGTLAALSQDHPVQSYCRIAESVQSDAVLVDTFLHYRDRSYTVNDCIELLNSAGLVFQSWLLKAPYYPHEILASADTFHQVINALPEPKLWSIMERINTLNACHYFVACRPDRDKSTYTIDFSSDNSLDYVPVMRLYCGLAGTEIYRPDWRMSLTPPQLAFVRQIDGRRSIREIADLVFKDSPRASKVDLERFGRRLFQALWRLDFLAMNLVK